MNSYDERKVCTFEQNLMNMKRTFKIQLFLLLIFCMSSCASAGLLSNKSSEFDKPVSRIYVVMGGNNNAGHLIKSIRYYLHKEFSDNMVVSKFFIPSSLALSNDKTIKNQIQSFKPDVVLFIDATNVSRSQGGMYSTSPYDYAELELQISKPGETDLLWKGEMSVTGNLFSNAPGKKASKAIRKQLIKDNVIVGSK